MDEARLELKVGAFAGATVVALLGLLWLMGELSLGGSGRLSVDFSHTGNVLVGAPVKLGGVGIGHVREVRLFPERRDAKGVPLPVRMTLALRADAAAALRRDMSVTVSSVGPLGEPYLELVPGSAAEPWPSDAAVRGLDAPRMDLVSNRLSRFLEAASQVLEDDPEALHTLIIGIGRLTQTADSVLADSRPQLRQLADDLAATAADLRFLAATARAQLEPGGAGLALLEDGAALVRVGRAELPELARRASAAAGAISSASAPLTVEDGRALKAAIKDLAASAAQLEHLAASTGRVLAALEAGDGTAGLLLKDKRTAEDLRSLISDLRRNPWKIILKPGQ